MDEIRKKAKQDYGNGMKYKDICYKYNISINTLKSWIKKYKRPAEKKKGVPLNNANSVDNDGKLHMALAMVLMGVQLDILLNVEYIGLIIGFIIDEGISIIENYGLIAFKLPEMLSNAFDILRKHKDGKI